MAESRSVHKKRLSPFKRRTGGRSARIRIAVLQASKATLLRRGFERFSIAEVAKLSGVHETSIYRRWRTKPALIVQTLLAHFEQKRPIPNTGVLDKDLVGLLRSVSNILRSRLGITFMRMVAGPTGVSAEMKEIRKAYWAERRPEAMEILKRGIERGELPEDTDLNLLLDTLIGTFYVRALMTGGPLNAKLPRQVTDLVLHGVIRRATRPTKQNSA